MLAMATGCALPAVSLVTPAYCENPEPSRSEALIWNWLPDTENETGTAPLATPPMMSVAATATGTAARTMRPAWVLVSFRNFIGPPPFGWESRTPRIATGHRPHFSVDAKTLLTVRQ